MFLCIGLLATLPDVTPTLAAFATEGEGQEDYSTTIQSDLDALTAESLRTVPALDGEQANILIDNLVLPTQGAGGSVISWSSSSEAITDTGIVTRGEERAEVTLTATASFAGDTGTKEFVFIVPASTEQINGIPASTGVLQTSDFSEGKISLSDGSGIKLTQVGGSVTNENGKLKLLRTVDDASECSAIFNYPNTNLTGNFVTEFLLSKDAGQAASVKMWGDAQYFQIDWTADGFIQAYYSDTEGQQGTAYTLTPSDFACADRVKLTLFTCGERGTISLWINNRPAFLDKFPYKDAAGDMKANCITCLLYTSDAADEL